MLAEGHLQPTLQQDALVASLQNTHACVGRLLLFCVWCLCLDCWLTAVKDYLWKWGRQDPYRAGRYIGEISETYRDLYHSQFGE